MAKNNSFAVNEGSTISLAQYLYDHSRLSSLKIYNSFENFKDSPNNISLIFKSAFFIADEFIDDVYLSQEESELPQELYDLVRNIQGIKLAGQDYI